MKVLYVTNIISPHQIPLARQIVELVGVDNFLFVATELPKEERVKLGWNADENETWILRARENDAYCSQFEQWWDEADVVICGDRRFSRMNDRLEKGKLTFYMSERWWKPPIGMMRQLHPRFALMKANFMKIAKSPHFHYLPMGLYAAADMKHIADFYGKMWQWGYFTELPNQLPTIDREDPSLHVLWAGRMLAWKRVKVLIRAFSQLQHECRVATLTLVGFGPERIRLEKLAKKCLVDGTYRFLPQVPAHQVIELMKQHHIYVLPSNGYEGWGAVINEAMSAGCAVIASKEGGAAKSMIVHGKNGLLFNAGDWRSLAACLELLSRNETMRRQLAEEGQRTINECWSPAIAAERFVTVCASLLAGYPVPTFVNGPMAPCW
ncbi:MAG: glycosyltransferase family 4 protein [Chlorobium sp.]|nr:MAG: glycosyltransferase family 4 protein [Chlorobium sp.]